MRRISDYQKNATELAQLIRESDPSLLPPATADIASSRRPIEENMTGLPDPEHPPPRYRCHEYAVEFQLRNVGEKTIREFEVWIIADAPEGYGLTTHERPQPVGGFWERGDIATFRSLDLRVTEKESLTKIPQPRIWPGARCSISTATILVPESRPIASWPFIVKWVVYLDDVRPNEGEIDLTEDIQAGYATSQ